MERLEFTTEELDALDYQLECELDELEQQSEHYETETETENW